MIISKLIGISLFFLGLGVWVVVIFTFAFWFIPWVILAFIAGYLTKTHEWPGLRDYSIWKWIRNEYFQFSVETSSDMPTEGKFIYAIYPHGHFSLTTGFFWGLNPKFKKARAAIHSAIFYLPFFGSFARWIGAIEVTEKSMTDTLKKNIPIYMCPGGVSEIEKTGLDIVYRKGFLRVAHKTDSTVIPVWCPDERSYYTQYLPLGYTLSSILSFPIPMFLWGVSWCPLLPKYLGRKSRILVGKHIETTNKKLNEVEDDFWEELTRLQQIN